MSPHRQDHEIRTKRKKNYRKMLLNFVPLLLAVLLCSISIFFLLSLISTGPNMPTTFGGLTVFHDCTISPKVFVGLTPKSGTSFVDVTISVDDYKKAKDSCTNFEVHFPGSTINHQYLIEAEFPDNSEITSEEYEKLSRNETRRSLVQYADVYQDNFSGEDIISFKPNNIPDFAGTIEFLWIGGINRLSYSSVGILVPFSVLSSPENTLKHVQEYTVQIWSPRGYQLYSSSPEVTRIMYLGDLVLYEFPITTGKMDLITEFRNNDTESKKELGLIIFSTMLGIGLSILVEDLLSIYKAKAFNRENKERDND